MQVKTKNLIVGALGVALVGMLWFQFVYSPMESKASKARSSAHDADVSADNLRKAISGATSDNKKDKPKDISNAQLTAAVPVDAAESAFLRSLDDLRVSSGAEWQSVTPTAPTSTSGVTTISIGITVQGTEDQLAHYVSGLYDMKRIFVLDNVSITQNGSGAAPGSRQQFSAGAAFVGDNHIQMQLSGRIFGQPGAVAASSGTVSGGTGTTPATGAPAPTGPSGTQNS